MYRWLICREFTLVECYTNRISEQLTRRDTLKQELSGCTHLSTFLVAVYTMSHYSIEDIFKKLDELSFPDEILPVYELLKQNPERLSFVKDHNGIKNVVFLSTLNTPKEVFEFPYFSIFTEGEPNNLSSYLEMAYSPEQVYNKTKQFLENSNEVLYVGIGFPESAVLHDDYFEIYYLLEETKCNILDAFVSLRRFPEWYNDVAEYPYYINKQNELLNVLERYEVMHLTKQKEKLLNELNQSIEKNDKETFKTLSKQIRSIQSQIDSYEKR